MIRILAATAVGAAALAAPAGAKGPVDAEICGVEECRELRWAPHEDAEGQPHANLVLRLVDLTQSFSFAATPALAPYYRVTLETPGWEPAPFHVVPSAGVAERSRSWIRLDGLFVAAFRRAARGIEPYPRPRIERALVNGRPSESPELYGALFGRLDEASAPPTGTPSAEIRLVTDPPSPWTERRGPLRYHPTTNTLRRPLEWVQVPDELADRIEADLTGVRKREAGRSWPALTSTLLLVSGLGGVVWMTLVRRRAAGRRQQAA